MKVIIPEPESEGTFEGWVRVDEDAIRIYDKMIRIQKDVNRLSRGNVIISSSFLIHLTDEGRSAHWLKLKHKAAKELIDKHMAQNIKYRNCTMQPFFYMKTSRYCISVWPQHEQDLSLNKENNWGDEE